MFSFFFIFKKGKKKKEGNVMSQSAAPAGRTWPGLLASLSYSHKAEPFYLNRQRAQGSACRVSPPSERDVNGSVCLRTAQKRKVSSSLEVCIQKKKKKKASLAPPHVADMSAVDEQMEAVDCAAPAAAASYLCGICNRETDRAGGPHDQRHMMIIETSASLKHTQRM